VDDDERPDGLRRLIAAISSMGADLDLPVVLHRITEAAVELVGATYGALGVLSPEGTNLSAFITVGLDDEAAAEIGELPKGHGILGLLIVRPEPLRLNDLREHAESFGFPPGHPEMASFLGVPIQVHGRVFGNLYLTDKRGGHPFTDADEELAVALAAAAGIAIESSRLLAREREIDIANERERIARDLHDTVIQRLFAAGLSLQAASSMSHDERIQARLATTIEDLDETIRELRNAIFALQSPDPGPSGVRGRILDVVTAIVPSLGFEPRIEFDGAVETVDERIVEQLVPSLREALTNVAKHAEASSVRVSVSVGTEVVVQVADDGVGVPAEVYGGHGLANLARRAEKLGGAADVGPLATGSGCSVRWCVPATLA